MMYIFRYFAIYYQKRIVVFFGNEGRGEGGGVVMEVIIVNILSGGA